MTRFREHRRFLDEAMETQREVKDRAALIEFAKSTLDFWGVVVTNDTLHVEPYYGADERIGWVDTYIVTIDGFGVFGFSEGPLNE